jgi:dTDP-L-rhamnose 4-epimerase
MGFIGRALVRRLRAEGREVRILDSLSPQVHPSPEEMLGDPDLVVGDIRDPAAVESAAEGCPAVVHLAAETGVGQSMYERSRYEDVNVAGSQVVAQAAARAGALLVNLSSRAVYGEGAYECAQHGERVGGRCCLDATPRASRESDPLEPTSVYGETKQTAEEAVAAGNVLTLRPQNVIGAGQAVANPYTGVLAAFAARLRAGLDLQIFGDGSQTRDYVHVEDVVSIIAWALDNPGNWPPGRRMNVGSGRRSTLVELAHAMARAHGMPEADLSFLPIRRAGDIEHACADLEVLRSAGAPIPATGLDVAVGDFAAWAATQPAVSPKLWDAALEELEERRLLA